MAREAVKVMVNEGLTPDERTAAPYFNCVGFVWAQLLTQPKEVWDQIISERRKEISE